jgi:hypothetical protein
MKNRALLGVAAGLTALTVGAGIASAQSNDDGGTDDTVVDQPSTTDNSTTDNSTTDNSTTDTSTAPDDSPSRGDRAGCDHGADEGGAPANPTAPSTPTAPDDSSS